MAKFRKKPVVIEAEVYHAGLEDGWEYEDEIQGGLTSAMYAASKVDGVRLYPYISTLEGRHYIGAGDYIITGIKGERYPCKPDIFEQTYEAVE
ncbi:hypothetical protein LCGC14_0513620 [marine sediment metagenome]|uniref:Phage protein n=1 Tax=marine sediment metagenome TaxID=412755 RepID=A0A0F9S0D9_9ZZZZ